MAEITSAIESDKPTNSEIWNHARDNAQRLGMGISGALDDYYESGKNLTGKTAQIPFEIERIGDKDVYDKVFVGMFEQYFIGYDTKVNLDDGVIEITL